MKWICYVYAVDERIQSRFTSHTMSWCHYFYPAHDLDPTYHVCAQCKSY